MQRYAFQLIRHLDDILSKDLESNQMKFILLVPRGHSLLITPLTNIQIVEVSSPFGIFFWEQVQLPFYTWGNALLNLTGSAPLFKVLQYCTIHDAAIYEISHAYTWKFLLWYKTLFFVQSRICLSLFTVSESSKFRLALHLKISPDRIRVISNAAEHILEANPDNRILEKFNLLYGSYFLTVGSANPSKNINFLINAFLMLHVDSRIKLVVVGGINNKVFAEKDNISYVSGSNVIYTGRINDSELRSLYENAKAFVFPSIYEGFGIPPLEAMSCGCPVLASNFEAILEVCGDGAEYFDPSSTNSILNCLMRALNEEGWLDKVRYKGLIRSKFYSWHSIAQNLLKNLST